MDMKSLFGIIRKIFYAFAAAVYFAAASYAASPDSDAPKGQAELPKYIFIMFGDGMGLQHITVTEDYKYYLREHPEALEKMPFDKLDVGSKRLNFRYFPIVGLCETQSADRYVTGSPEAATSMFAGVKSRNGYVGVDADGNSVESLFVTLHKRGYQVGLLSTDPINHATPAACYAHTLSRGDYKAITRAIPASGFEFLSGDSFIDFENTDGNADADQFLRRHGYTIYYGADDFVSQEKHTGKTVLVNERNRTVKSNITAQIDQNKNYELSNEKGTNILATQLECCLKAFDHNRPFVILAEEGEIDHSSHLNFARSVVHHVLRLEEAVDVALRFYAEHPDQTLILVVSDHETGGIAGQTFKPHIRWEMLDDEWYSGRDISTFTVAECRAFCKKAGIRWATSSHTGGLTPVFAVGAHSDRFSGCYDNTELYSRILGLQEP